MGRGGTTKSEIVRRGDDPPAEAPLPDAVDNHPRRERIASGGQPLGQGQAPAAGASPGRRRNRQCRGIERSQDAGYHLLARFAVAPLGEQMGGRNLRHFAHDLGDRRAAERCGKLDAPRLETVDLRPHRAPFAAGLRPFGPSVGRRGKRLETFCRHLVAGRDRGDLRLNRLVVGRDLGGNRGRVDRHLAGVGPLKTGLDPEEVRLEERVGFVVVTVAAAHREPEDGRAGRRDDLGEELGPVPLRFLEDRRRAVEGTEPEVAGGDKGPGPGFVGGWVGRQFIAGELLGEESVVGHVGVEGIDAPIAVAPDLRPQFVALEAIGIGVANGIEPGDGKMLAIGGAGKEPVDKPLDRVVGLVGDEGLHLVGGRREPRDIERHPAHERAPVGAGVGPDSRRGEPVVEEGVDDRRGGGALIADRRRHSWPDERLERPQIDSLPAPAPRYRIARILPGRAHRAAIVVLRRRRARPWRPRGDPRLDQRDLVPGQRLVRRHRGHGRILPADGTNQEAGVGIPRYDRWAGLPPASEVRSRIEREPPLRIMPRMALQTADHQERFDPACQRPLIRPGASGGKGREQHDGHQTHHGVGACRSCSVVPRSHRPLRHSATRLKNSLATA